MGATDKRLCDTCMNDKCPVCLYGGKGPVIDREPTEMCEYYESMSGSDELRRLLDERGVEWMPSVFDPQHETFYSTDNGVGFIVTEFPEIGRMSLACDMRITPKQAIDATLGRGTCHVETTENWLPAERYHRCKHCGAFFAVLDASGDIPPRVCPNCARKVVDE